ncbi:MAG: class I SAM-dependent methyltransferase [Deltaproteobacteria bacterium]|nr:class I SAM-dependent methyltransferase [Deltaproteobacteria bacterium]
MNVATTIERLLAFGDENGLRSVLDARPTLELLAEEFRDHDVQEVGPRELERVFVEAGFDAAAAHSWFDAKRSAWSAAYGSDRGYQHKWGAHTPCDVLERWYADQPRPPARALDLGCGDGVNAVFMASKGTAVDAVDLSPAAIETVGRNAAAAGVTVHGMVGSVHDLPSDAGPYDLVFDRGCFHHVPIVFWHLYIEQIERMLAPGGTLLLMCHTPKVFPDRYVTLAYGHLGRVVQFFCDGKAESSFSPSDLRAIFGDRFEIVEQRRAPDHEGKPFEFNVCLMRSPQP